MKSFQLSMPTKVYFGDGILDKALQQEKDLIRGTVMIVTGQSAMRRLGYLDRVQGLLESLSTVDRCLVAKGMSPNPRIEEIMPAAERGLTAGVNLVIGLGGGSALDAAKGVAVGMAVAARNETLEPYVLEGKEPPADTLPLVAIPTTAGTGSEVSRTAIISSLEKGIKNGIRGDRIFPRVAIVDPELTHGMPVRITAETGFDVFTHAAETYISRKANPFTEMLSVEAMHLTAEYLPLLMQDLSHREARSRMSYASMLMGISLGNASTCLPHRLQYPIGALTDTSHSAGLACLYQAWVCHGYEYAREKFNTIGSILCGSVCRSREEVLQSLTAFMDLIGVNYKLPDLGLHRDQLQQLCDGVAGSLDNDPAYAVPDIVRRIYADSF
jgi:alcohol dehydrogenase class IV